MPYDEKLAARIRAKLASVGGVSEKKMFGGVGFMVSGNMACGVIGPEMIVRLGDDEFEAALKKPHVRVFDFSGKPMKGWIYVSAEGTATERALKVWIDKGLAFAESLPAK
jgi:TfoX/Sxy family transcriptional regulator of competence genes